MKRSDRRSWTVLVAEDNDDHALLIQMALEEASDIPVEIVRALPHLDPGTVRTHIVSRCCVNAPKNHPQPRSSGTGPL